MRFAPPQVLAILRMLIEERAGIRYSDSDRELIESKVVSRASSAGYDSLLDYYYYLRYDAASGAEFDELVDSLVVNETYFFREALALEVVTSEVLRPLLEAGRRPRVWSAACSTGEEPYTLAMLLAEQGCLHQVELLGTDISERALTAARSGRFRTRSLRSDELPTAAAKYLATSPTGLHLSSEISNAVQFRKVNLLDTAAVEQQGVFDVILCRNVLIYFADDTVQRVVASLARRLRPGGVLLVGTCESLLRHSTSLICEEHQGVFFYRKPV